MSWFATLQSSSVMLMPRFIAVPTKNVLVQVVTGKFVYFFFILSFRSGGSSEPDRIPCRRDGCGGEFVCVRHVSFVDCPGHDILMATMLNGAAVMDAALLLVAGNEPCPQPQTSEHLAAVEIMQLKNLLILQNKIDLIKESQAKDQHEQIKNFVQGTVADSAPIIPISAQLKYNIDVSFFLNCFHFLYCKFVSALTFLL